MLKFELKKFLKRTPIFLVIGGILLAVTLLFITNIVAERRAIAQEKQDLTVTLSRYKQALKTLDEAEADLKLSLEDGIIDNEAKLAGMTGTPTEYLDWFIADGEKYQIGEKAGMTYDTGSVPEDLYVKTKEQMLIIKEDNLVPIYPLNYLSEVGEVGNLDKTNLLQWQNLNRQYKTKSLYFFWELIQKNAPLYLIMIIIVSLFGSFSSEQQKNKKHLEFYQAEKLSPTRLFFTNFSGKVIFSFIFSIVVFIAIWLIASLINGTGSLAYPVPIRTFSMITLTFIPLSTYLLKAILLYTLVLLFSLALTSFIEILIKQPLVSVLVELLVVYVGVNFTPMNKFNPFAYFKVDPIIIDGFPVTYEDISLLYVSLVFLGLICMMLILSYVIIKARNSLAFLENN